MDDLMTRLKALDNVMDRVELLPDIAPLDVAAVALGYTKARLMAGGKSGDLPYVEVIHNRETNTHTYSVIKPRLLAYLRGDDIGRERTIVLVTPDGIMPSLSYLKRLLGND